ncbi:hypothetical protein GCM10010430_28290 [Kitasatospora cystarginea]|uniref:Uncharacterized protein n=1 Tax=Kitasatospora cystarginea TaxID=58350 RepID=A0ABN3DZ34_9ACTN
MDRLPPPLPASAIIISPSGTVVGRFRPRTEPESAELVAAVEAQLPA